MIVLTAEARGDLSEALASTERRRGRAQQRADGRLLTDIFVQPARFPGLGRSRPEHGIGIRSYRARQHAVLYEAPDTEIRIAQTLHVRRDIDGEREDSSS